MPRQNHTIHPSGLRAIGAAAAVAAAFAVQPAGAEVSFKDKQINVIIGSSPGGGSDLSTRLAGEFLSKHLPGQPEMIYRNMPSGGGVKAENFLYNQAPKDGTYWIGGSSSHVDANRLRSDLVKYNPIDYTFIGGIARGGSIVSVRKAKLPNLTDKSMPPVIVGGTDGSRSWGQLLQWGAEYLDWNVKFVIGYRVSSDLYLAMRRGEIDCMGTSRPDVHHDLYKTGDFTGLVQIGEKSEGKIVPRQTFPDIPVLAHLLDGKTSGLGKEAFEYWVKTNQIDKFYALPPGVDPDVGKTYQAAWKALSKDPEFIRKGKFQFSDDFSPQSAADVRDLIESTAYPSIEIAKFLQDLKVRHGLPATPLSPEEMQQLAIERGAVKQVKAKLDEVKREGRRIFFKSGDGTHSAKISKSRTQIMVGGKKAKRSDLKAGLACEILYPEDKGEAMKVDCQ